MEHIAPKEDSTIGSAAIRAALLYAGRPHVMVQSDALEGRSRGRPASSDFLLHRNLSQASESDIACSKAAEI